jgi:hypothetical protein
MDKIAAINTIDAIFAQYNAAGAHLHTQAVGKVYELYCLGRVVERLVDIGCQIQLPGSGLVGFKASPGPINTSYPSIDVSTPSGLPLKLWTDIEFQTLSACQGHTTDRSERYELDIVLVPADVTGLPRVDEIVLGIECKAHQNVSKGVVKQLLGVRREMSLLSGPVESWLSEICMSTPVRRVSADPPSELWLFHTHPDIRLYADGPEYFGIETIQDAP